MMTGQELAAVIQAGQGEMDLDFQQGGRGAVDARNHVIHS